VHPELAGWERVVAEAAERGAPAVRADPTFYGIAPAGGAMCRLAAACGGAAVPLLLAVRFEDGRQRHPNDRGEELPPSAVRALIRSDPRVRILVTHADRGFIEEVHFGSTPDEAARLWWDISWVWGPPEDHLELLLGTIGPERFVFGSGQPLRLPETPVARLDLLGLSAGVRTAIESGNARMLAG
jgi:predicted TIM-barrel fold metal-dependent hydrolase